ncbi:MULTISPECIES: Asp23/Gls24 family envelope stress response protein [Aneurinibacillus]|uniref:Asp23/Gls24 family envelope stress response protein n=1 Tax=Aneurinibacillus thermoaerophilus TaxID=143495 RepID=A0ABX8Y7V7_ANETH|nr:MULTISPECIES: Asp23/Gls24 family envelope stress response protein [Aneurinibacillus]AMA74639.1 alkaline-shock protein [Aneurinibacillus sp. XH2]MED0675597.1 Asp23/Gls24 family envelope stress response protein [Aneurinibacillus thermoaerophilus]MED0681292.1 Asp23/Gls24 family envelope stress response protein [Aneurinibacillus thermoaerophilus]MED0735498.1 Asp23/Gls24 family envelope stress response protein [Aneurinibacillus thermoaerophilus]MED0756618.1 Asp23/Gls24 family envelope stress res
MLFLDTGIEFSQLELGKIEIAPEVIEVIAHMASAEVPGVAGLSSGIVSDFVERLGRKSSRGVRVDIKEKEATIDLYIIVEYGQQIPDVAYKVQENVRESIQNMTGLVVTQVNVHIVDVQLKQEKEKKAPGTEEVHRVR